MKVIQSKDYDFKGVDERGWYVFRSIPGKFSDPEEIAVPRAKLRKLDGTFEILDYHIDNLKVPT